VTYQAAALSYELMDTFTGELCLLQLLWIIMQGQHQLSYFTIQLKQSTDNNVTDTVFMDRHGCCTTISALSATDTDGTIA
jgi:hypothetical protein